MTLSERQSQILYWMARGRSRRAISRELGISVRTVDEYLSRMRRKTDLTLLEFYLEHQSEVDACAGYDCP